MWLHVPDTPPEVTADDLALLSLCAGGAMLDVGVALALETLTGRRVVCVGYCERETGAAATLVARMADAGLDSAPVWDDLATLPCELWRDRVAVVSAGIPCQPWSVAGKKLGIHDPRWLWPLVKRALCGVGADVLVLENVPGFLAPSDGPEAGWVYPAGLQFVLGDLAEMGWDAEWVCVSAEQVGAHHRRWRVFLVARSHTMRPRYSGQNDSLCAGRDAAHAPGRDGPNSHCVRRDDEGTAPQGTVRDKARSRPSSQHSQRADAERAERWSPNDGSRGSPQREHRKRQTTGRSDGGNETRPDAEGVEGRLLLQPGRSHEADAEPQRQRSSGPNATHKAGNRRQRKREEARPGTESGLERCGSDGPIPGGARHQERPRVGRNARKKCPPAERAGAAGPPPVPVNTEGLPFFSMPPQECAAWQTGWLIEPAVEPGLRVGLHGLALVVDEARDTQLRTAGNGVVALQAAVAVHEAGRRLGIA